MNKLLYKIKNNFSDLKPFIFISWAWMIKIRLVENEFWRFHYHFFWLDCITKEIINNKHVHSFQAISNVLSWKIKEELYSFNKLKNFDLSKYNLIDNFMRSLWSIEQKVVINYLDLILVWKECKKPSFFNNFLIKNNISVSDILEVHIIYNSIKEQSNNWSIKKEVFKSIWMCNLKYLWDRLISSWDLYVLKSENWHKVNILEESSTLFLSDISYRSKWYRKDNSTLMRWHAKRFAFMQEKVENRKFWLYYTYDELKEILINEISSLINKQNLKWK